MEADYNSAILELLQVNPLEFLLVFKGMLVRPQTLRRFRERSIPVYCFYPDVSFKDHGSNIWECLPLYDCVFTTKSYHLADATLKSRVRDLQLVSHGFDPEVHRPVVVSEDVGRVYSCDVSFVGYWSVKKERHLRELVERLPAVDVRIWGPSWYMADPVVRNRWQGRGAWGDEIAAIHKCSKINLGLLSEAGTGVSSGDLTTARTWQIPASGGFMLHEDTPELRQAFRVGHEVGVFSGERDLADQVVWWLQHDLERSAASQAAYLRAATQPYTYANAVNAVLEWHNRKIGNV